MKLNTEKFKSVLNIVSSISVKTKSDFTEQIKISYIEKKNSKGQMLRYCQLECAGSELMVVGKVATLSGQKFEAVVNVANLMMFVRPIKREEFDIVLSGSVLRIMVGEVTHSLNTEDVEAFPIIPKFDIVKKYEKRKDLNRIGKLVSIPNADANNPSCKVIYFNAKDECNNDDILATDGITIGCLTLRTGIDKSFAIPVKSAEILAKMQGNMNIGLGKKYVKFTSEESNIILLSDIVDVNYELSKVKDKMKEETNEQGEKVQVNTGEKYVMYKRKISAVYEYSLKLVKKGLINAITQILLSSDKEKNCIALKVIDDETLELRTFNAMKEIGSRAVLNMSSNLPKGFLAGYNGKKLLEMISECEEEYISLQIRNVGTDRRILMDSKDIAIMLMNIDLIDGLNESIAVESKEEETKEEEIPVEVIEEVTKEEPKEVIHKFGSAEEVTAEEIPVEVKEVAEVIA
ncbi:MAG: hypothetical protein NTU73_09950 [Ignavibacteriae bacterium]|nr:hypothetical protein [Ignavibacteriota bacterium]